MIRKLITLSILVLLAGCGNSPPAGDTTIYFSGTVKEIKPLPRTEGRMLLVHPDPRYAVTIQVDTADHLVDQIKQGKSVVFAIHSPTKLFAEDNKQVIGKTYNFCITQGKEKGETRFTNLEVKRD